MSLTKQVTVKHTESFKLSRVNSSAHNQLSHYIKTPYHPKDVFKTFTQTTHLINANFY